jgi:uncharacterized protein involved in exopolysaccharide biosynthesis
VRRVPGNYSAWRALVLREREAEIAAKQAKSAADAKRAQQQAQAAEARAATTNAAAGARTTAVAAASPARSEGGKVKNPWLLKKIEESIIALEEERGALESSLVTEDVYRNAAKMKETQVRLAEIERELEVKNAEWESWA